MEQGNYLARSFLFGLAICSAFMSFGRFYLTFGATLFSDFLSLSLTRAGKERVHFLSRVMQSDGYLAGLLSQFSYQFLTHRAAKIRVSSLIDKKKMAIMEGNGI